MRKRKRAFGYNRRFRYAVLGETEHLPAAHDEQPVASQDDSVWRRQRDLFAILSGRAIDDEQRIVIGDRRIKALLGERQTIESGGEATAPTSVRLLRPRLDREQCEDFPTRFAQLVSRDLHRLLVAVENTQVIIGFIHRRCRTAVPPVEGEVTLLNVAVAVHLLHAGDLIILHGGVAHHQALAVRHDG